MRVLRPEVGSHSLTVTLTGEVHARTPVALRPLASGRVVQVSPALRAGGTFKAGETLFVVDPEDTELRLERAQGMLAAARGRLRRHQDQGALDAAQYRDRNPGAEVPPAVARLGQIERFEGRVQAAIADVKLAELQLSETRFSLPFDGTVIAAPVSVGEVVSRATSVGTVFQTGRLETRAPIPVADLAYLGDPRGQPAAVLARGQRFEAVVSQVSSVLAPRTRLSMLLLDFADANAPRPERSYASPSTAPRSTMPTCCLPRRIVPATAYGWWTTANCCGRRRVRWGELTPAGSWQLSTCAREWFSARFRANGPDWR
ncbi:MAG: HlyD family efflux transporter periplasmic adaptor subunit [Gammaproteobacteria bacterium]|nr:HlyD family efflux transporter periplasmic adaptor subunit [Gammaproteobacteria bacterium]